MRTVRTDCAHYAGDRPCAPHKKHGAVCDGCEHHEAAGLRVLIVKLDAIGDVLRTTCLLEPLSRQWRQAPAGLARFTGQDGRDARPTAGLAAGLAPGADASGSPPQVTWITRADSVPLLRGNPHVWRVVPYGPEALTVVEGETFDVVAALDASRDAASLAAIAARVSRPRELRGFTLRDGAVVPADERANSWWQMGLWDDLKRTNTRTYQSHIMELMGLVGEPGRYVLELGDDEVREARQLLRDAGLGERDRFLALNVGGGGRWEYKRWTEPHLTSFLRMVDSQLGLRVALLGGDAERALVERLLSQGPPGVFFPGVHSVRRFAAMLACCEVLVTGDTLAMHLALAAERPAAILFGPTSVAEIETYGLGEKLAPDMDCLCCYLPRCDRRPYCQESIEPARVLDSVRRLLARESSPQRRGDRRGRREEDEA